MESCWWMSDDRSEGADCSEVHYGKHHARVSVSIQKKEIIIDDKLVNNDDDDAISIRFISSFEQPVRRVSTTI